MASVFTFDPDPPRVSSPWSTPGTTTPCSRGKSVGDSSGKNLQNVKVRLEESDPGFLETCGIKKLDPEPQDGPTEYKLHLLLRPRRTFISLSSGNQVSGSYHSSYLSKSSDGAIGSGTDSSDTMTRPPLASSSSPRQNRLQQLTTQLLWRLQQSSPFHSSSVANLILPVLPEVTPTLDVPKILSPLLPGLEESQGALYEIGVTDDGSFIGLAEDELDESLINLRAMAASLGCKVDVLRKVAVGYCKWEEGGSSTKGPSTIRTEKLWVAEALVCPSLERSSSSLDLTGNQSRSRASNPLPPSLSEVSARQELPEQLHVAIAGASGAGKSSLLGILSTSALDNGRGKSRLSLLKHRHEIASGVTSSIAQELIGYSDDRKDKESANSPEVINYALGNVTSWDDIHVTAGTHGRVVFLSDLPGSLKYIKSTLRGLMSLKPHYVLLCVPADNSEDPSLTESSEVGVSLAYLELCVKLDIPVVVVVTKLDSATRSSIRQTLAQVLSAIKLTGRKPVMLPVPAEPGDQDMMDLQNITPSDQRDASTTTTSIGSKSLDEVLITITSAVTGAGIGKLHALLRSLHVPSHEPSVSMQDEPSREGNQDVPETIFNINEVFEMPLFKVYSLSNETKRHNDRGIVLCGRVGRGMVSIGDRLFVGPIVQDIRAGNEAHGHGHGHYASKPKTVCSKSLPDSLPFTGFRKASDEGLESQSQAIWKEVRVVSVRNLRLPVRGLSERQIGTVGIDLVDSSSCFGRIRKGMVLAKFNQKYPISASSGPASPHSISLPLFRSGFIARLPASDFAPSSVSIVSGGTALVYIRSIRAAARIISVETVKRSISSTSTETEIFKFDPTIDSYDGSSMSRTSETNGIGSDQVRQQQKLDSEEVNVTFSLSSSVEWIEVGSLVLAVPGTGIATPSSSSSSLPSQSRGLAVSSGLQGFVGRVCEVLHS